NVLDNVVKMGEYLMDGLKALEKKYEIIGDVRGKGLFCGLELVKSRTTKEPVSEAVAGAIVGECMKQGVIIGKTSRCFRELNNTLCLAPALIATTAEIDEILKALDNAFQAVKA
ncbi:aminotransferase class III-fold pyridoxal phosphate-dependent enzyme, partial [uncultured Desulfovibrio sp.]